MKLKVSDILSKIIYALCAVCFILVIIRAFWNSIFEYDPLWLGLSTLLALGAMFGFCLLVRNKESFFKKHGDWFTLGFLILMGACQILLSFKLRYTPVYDIEAIYDGAIKWATTGDFTEYYEYFAMFHNNFGGLVLMRVWFGLVNLFGIKSYFISASVFNSALSLSAMYLTGSVLSKLIGERARITAYFIFLISLPFYFIAPTFYTDSLTMVFPVLAFWLWLKARDEKRFIVKLLYFVLMGLSVGLGYGIKATVLIMLIAIVIEAVLYYDLKTWLSLAACTAALVLAFNLAVHGIVYSHIGREYAEEKQVPLTHWIMMGLYGWGGYNSTDYEFTKSFEDPDERSEAVKERLLQRLKSLDAEKAVRLFGNKIDLVFCDGTYGLADCLGCPHGDDNFLHSFLLREGENHAPYKYFTTGVLMALYVLLIVSCVFGVVKKAGTEGIDTVRILAPRLALFGLFVFFLIWEARWRYFSNYVPVIMICAVIGLECLMSAVGRRTVKDA